jgi:hypothetical protein
MAKKTPSTTARDFLRVALERWNSANTSEEKQRSEGATDQRFLNLDQWDANDERDRGDRPTLVVDQIGEPYRQLVGRQQSAKPAILVSPIDSGADVDTADVFQGLIRHVENKGHAKAARDEAFKGAVGIGWGYYRIVTEFENEGDPTAPMDAMFDQGVRYQAIENPMTVFRDPSCPLHEPEKAMFCFHIEDIPQGVFEDLYDGAISKESEAFQATGIESPDWFPENSVRVADYFYVETVDGPEVAIVRGEDGSEQVEWAKDVPKGAEIVQKRRLRLRQVKLAKITAAEVLEGNLDKTAGRDWAGMYIPIIPVWGESLISDGKRTLRGIVRPARDSQRMYNYHNSELVYDLALSPKSKVMASVESIEGLEAMWKQAATMPFPALLTRAFDANGRPLPQPTVAQFTDANKIQALVVAINQAKTDLRSTTGWYDATDPGRRNAEQSGRAIVARKEAQAEGTVNYQDQFGQALLYEGTVLLDLIPKIYTRPGRVLRLVGLEDEEQAKLVTMGETYEGEKGVERIYEWGAGRYDVAVTVGASYTTRRQEAASWQLDLMKILPPQMAAAMAPLAIKNVDAPGNREIAKRLNDSLPPELRSDDEGEEQPQIPPEVRQQMEKAQQLIDGLTQKVTELTQAIQTDQIKSQAEAQRSSASDAVKERIAQISAETQMAKVRADLMLKMAELDANQGRAMLQEETKRLAKLADLQPPQPPQPMAPPPQPPQPAPAMQPQPPAPLPNFGVDDGTGGVNGAPV